MDVREGRARQVEPHSRSARGNRLHVLPGDELVRLQVRGARLDGADERVDEVLPAHAPHQTAEADVDVSDAQLAARAEQVQIVHPLHLRVVGIRSSTSCASGISLERSWRGFKASAPRRSRMTPSKPRTSSQSTRFTSPRRVRTRSAVTRGYAAPASARRSTSVPKRSPFGPTTGRPSKSERKRNDPSGGGWLAAGAGGVVLFSLVRPGTRAR